jgi:hypothetical protein
MAKPKTTTPVAASRKPTAYSASPSPIAAMPAQYSASPRPISMPLKPLLFSPPKKKRISQWPFYILALIGIAWLLQDLMLANMSLPWGPVATLWASLSLILLARQI